MRFVLDIECAKCKDDYLHEKYDVHEGLKFHCFNCDEEFELEETNYLILKD